MGSGSPHAHSISTSLLAARREMALGYLQRVGERALEGVVWVAGFPSVKPGERLTIEEPPFPLPGVFRVLGVVHVLTPAGGMTRLEVSRPHLLSRVGV
ncbi:MAG: hypothetical protein ACKO6N_08640 [Myxococcota bacterium]